MSFQQRLEIDKIFRSHGNTEQQTRFVEVTNAALIVCLFS